MLHWKERGIFMAETPTPADVNPVQVAPAASTSELKGPAPALKDQKGQFHRQESGIREEISPETKDLCFKVLQERYASAVRRQQDKTLGFDEIDALTITLMEKMKTQPFTDAEWGALDLILRSTSIAYLAEMGQRVSPARKVERTQEARSGLAGKVKDLVTGRQTAEKAVLGWDFEDIQRKGQKPRFAFIESSSFIREPDPQKRKETVALILDAERQLRLALTGKEVADPAFATDVLSLEYIAPAVDAILEARHNGKTFAELQAEDPDAAFGVEYEATVRATSVWGREMTEAILGKMGKETLTQQRLSAAEAAKKTAGRKQYVDSSGKQLTDDEFKKIQDEYDKAQATLKTAQIEYNQFKKEKYDPLTQLTNLEQQMLGYQTELKTTQKQIDELVKTAAGKGTQNVEMVRQLQMRRDQIMKLLTGTPDNPGIAVQVQDLTLMIKKDPAYVDDKSNIKIKEIQEKMTVLNKAWHDAEIAEAIKTRNSLAELSLETETSAQIDMVLAAAKSETFNSVQARIFGGEGKTDLENMNKLRALVQIDDDTVLSDAQIRRVGSELFGIQVKGTTEAEFNESILKELRIRSPYELSWLALNLLHDRLAAAVQGQPAAATEFKGLAKTFELAPVRQTAEQAISQATDGLLPGMGLVRYEPPLEIGGIRYEIVCRGGEPEVLKVSWDQAGKATAVNLHGLGLEIDVSGQVVRQAGVNADVAAIREQLLYQIWQEELKKDLWEERERVSQAKPFGSEKTPLRITKEVSPGAYWDFSLDEKGNITVLKFAERGGYPIRLPRTILERLTGEGFWEGYLKEMSQSERDEFNKVVLQSAGKLLVGPAGSGSLKERGGQILAAESAKPLGKVEDFKDNTQTGVTNFCLEKVLATNERIDFVIDRGNLQILTRDRSMTRNKWVYPQTGLSTVEQYLISPDVLSVGNPNEAEAKTVREAATRASFEYLMRLAPEERTKYDFQTLNLRIINPAGESLAYQLEMTRDGNLALRDIVHPTAEPVDLMEFFHKQALANPEVASPAGTPSTWLESYYAEWQRRIGTEFFRALGRQRRQA